MSSNNDKTYKDFSLPPSVVSRTDLANLASELESVDNDMTANSVRSELGANSGSGNNLSQHLSDFLEINQLSLDDSGTRSWIIREIRNLKDAAPVIHMTFSVEADKESLSKLADWLRSSVHPQAVVSTGLQPSLVAGVYLRTPNHVHDFSLRSKLQASRGVLLDKMRELKSVE